MDSTNSTNSTTIQSTLSEIKCPPEADSLKAKKKRGAALFANKWLKEMPKYTSYAFSGKQGVIGNNFFKNTGKTCNNSEHKDYLGYEKDPCFEQAKHIYVRGYPAKAESCSEIYEGKNKKKLKNQKKGQGILESVSRDFQDIGSEFLVRGGFGSGHLGNNKCVQVELPVGTNLDNKDKENEDWKLEKQCVPEAPMLNLKYGNEVYQMPYSGCEIADGVEKFQTKSKSKSQPKPEKPPGPILLGMIASCLAILLYQLRMLK